MWVNKWWSLKLSNKFPSTPTIQIWNHSYCRSIWEDWRWSSEVFEMSSKLYLICIKSGFFLSRLVSSFDPAAFEGPLLPARRSANLKRPLGKLKRQGLDVVTVFFWFASRTHGKSSECSGKTQQDRKGWGWSWRTKSGVHLVQRLIQAIEGWKWQTNNVLALLPRAVHVSGALFSIQRTCSPWIQAAGTLEKWFLPFFGSAKSGPFVQCLDSVFRENA